MAKLEVLVVGATGRQGGAVAHALLRGGHRVRALTRNLGHAAAETLRLRGARLAWADLDDERALEEAVRGTDAVFAVTASRDGAEAEARRGLLLTEVARRCDVAHFVYSSSLLPAPAAGQTAPDGKHEVEQYLRAVALPHTILCPAFFMENFTSAPWSNGLRSGALYLPVPATRKVQQIATSDFGRFVRLLLERPDVFIGRRVAIASDALTPIETAATLARATSRPVVHAESDESAAVLAVLTCGVLEPTAVLADIPALRQAYPEVNWHTLADWAKKQDWAVAQPQRA